MRDLIALFWMLAFGGLVITNVFIFGIIKWKPDNTVLTEDLFIHGSGRLFALDPTQGFLIETGLAFVLFIGAALLKRSRVPWIWMFAALYAVLLLIHIDTNSLGKRLIEFRQNDVVAAWAFPALTILMVLYLLCPGLDEKVEEYMADPRDLSNRAESARQKHDSRRDDSV